jgi:thymidylate synthase ThyX
MTEPSAKVLLDSISVTGHRLTTMEIVTHRFVWSEFMTHRGFSRNSASSRAIPIAKNLDKVMEDIALPISWGSKKPGMQAGPPLSGNKAHMAEVKWLEARDKVVSIVRQLDELGLHKEVANRLLEPFLWHKAIVSATSFDNFWNLRCSELAQPEIRALAYAMREAYEESEPTLLSWGEWHTPLILDEEYESTLEHDRKHISAARCARISYLTHDGIRDQGKDLELFKDLRDPGEGQIHASPLEHVATPAIETEKVVGNFEGWHQLRHQVEQEKLKEALANE